MKLTWPDLYQYDTDKKSRSPHVERARGILKQYPEVRSLMGPYFPTFFWIVAIVAFQWLMAFLLRESSWGLILFFSYLVGAFCNHGLYVLIHECCHNMVFRSSWANKLIGIVCDFALVVPSSMGFRNYHLLHHQYLGDYDLDADVSPAWEAKWIGNSWWRKLLWMSFFFISQGVFRPIKVEKSRAVTGWTLFNIAVLIVVNGLIWKLWGSKAILYLFLSTFWALGLHPLGGRWIQEHYTNDRDGQETFSYYGPLNKMTFNMGYHNEHHDFMMVPWVNLPKLKKMAPDYYDNLKSYRSWTKVLLNFIFNPQMSPFSRVVRKKERNFGKKKLDGESVYGMSSFTFEN